MNNRLWAAIGLALVGIGPLLARSAGAPAGVSGAPGDGNCTACHGGNAVNSGSGKVTLSFPNGNSYVPGQTQRVQVTITDAAAKRWGFEASPRVASNAAAQGAGTMAPADGNTALMPSRESLQWITHTSAGTRSNTTGPVTFEFDWTAPATDVGDVNLYVAANAANGNGANSGDLIYTTSATLKAAVAPPLSKPSVKSNGIVNAASLQSGLTTGSWITIFGDNLASTSRAWDTQREIVNGNLPAALDGTSVTVNGKPASVSYISPGQINAQAPDDDSTGTVSVMVTGPGGQSAAFPVTLQRSAPAFFLFDPQSRKYAAATAADGVSYLGPNALFGTSLPTRPAKPGEIIVLYGNGFGPTNPAVKSGQVFSGAAKLVDPVTVTIGGLTADVAFAGLSGAGLYQLNVKVPDAVANGDQPVVATINGVQSPSGVFLAVQK